MVRPHRKDTEVPRLESQVSKNAISRIHLIPLTLPSVVFQAELQCQSLRSRKLNSAEVSSRNEGGSYARTIRIRQTSVPENSRTLIRSAYCIYSLSSRCAKAQDAICSLFIDIFHRLKDEGIPCTYCFSDFLRAGL